MKKRIKKEFIEWGLLLTVFGVIYVGGWHTEVLGRLQQVMLSTGVLSAHTLAEPKEANFDFSLVDRDGVKADFRELKGEVIFLNFWATWCPPCIAEMPEINDLYLKKKDQVSFILISVDKDPQKARDFVRKKGFDFPIYFLTSSLPGSYDIQSIPTTYLIDKKGNIRVENHRMASYDTEDFRKIITELFEAE